MADVKFLQGTQEGYDALVESSSTNPNTFYFTGDNLYLGLIKLSNASDITKALSSLTKIETDIDNIEQSIGTLENLTTTEKGNLVGAINEILQKITDNATASQVSIEEDTTDTTYAKVYTVKQGTKTVGTINIPKDMVVSSGEVETNPDEEHIGTFIVLTLANATADKIYVEVGTLVDIYTAQASATQVQLAINTSTREISATIVANSITSAELAANAVTTAKIADGNVTYAKLAADIQTSLGLADSAVQTITEGTTAGTISVDGEDVKVHGLGGAAYKAVEDFDKAGAADQALKDAKAYADSLMTWGTF